MDNTLSVTSALLTAAAGIAGYTVAPENTIAFAGNFAIIADGVAYEVQVSRKKLPSDQG